LSVFYLKIHCTVAYPIFSASQIGLLPFFYQHYLNSVYFKIFLSACKIAIIRFIFKKTVSCINTQKYWKSMGAYLFIKK